MSRELFKKNFLFVDCETTGAYNGARIVQIAWIVYSNGIVVEKNNIIVKPKGFNIPDSAINVHGISNEKAQKEGIDSFIMLEKLKFSIDKYNPIFVGHNIDFDLEKIESEFSRIGKKIDLLNCEKFCTMKQTVNICKIPKSRGQGYKWPKLQELYLHLFRRNFKNAHDALIDIEATAKCFFKLLDDGLINRDLKNIAAKHEIQEAIRRERERQEAVRKAVESREDARREREYQEAVRKAMESREAARRENERREAVRKASESQEAAWREQREGQESVRKTIESQESAQKKCEKQEVAEKELLKHKIDEKNIKYISSQYNHIHSHANHNKNSGFYTFAIFLIALASLFFIEYFTSPSSHKKTPSAQPITEVNKKSENTKIQPISIKSEEKDPQKIKQYKAKEILDPPCIIPPCSIITSMDGTKKVYQVSKNGRISAGEYISTLDYNINLRKCASKRCRSYGIVPSGSLLRVEPSINDNGIYIYNNEWVHVSYEGYFCLITKYKDKKGCSKWVIQKNITGWVHGSNLFY